MTPKRKINITQSLIKDLDNYYEGDECGHRIFRKYSQGIFDEPTEAMRLGIYFEYLATGALPKSGKVPEPETLKDGKTLSSKYRIAEAQAQQFKTFCKDMGIKIQHVQKKKTRNGLEGTSDILAIMNGVEIVADLKYGGLIHNEWEPMGWGDLYGDNMRGTQYAYHSTQSLHYSYIFDRPFYFWVFSSVNVGENIFIEMVHTEQEYEHHLERAAEAAERWNKLMFHNKMDMAAVPEYNRCKDCVFSNSCEFKASLPEPKRISLFA